ncbi:tRNA (cmo5U34)-methyltransferase [Faunimonas pinastri]|uniref:tRNA (Cmo5U34)-methyltransferase n=1 Tax=Faunimonas pinastri TaxID=1855383 RepID=A0A1H9GSR5_9HYPH|nr:class I SAM-dependent methyltransferase [Faunimonas pinastri]SEQ53110.1 tRNA (cmo5U34)-methyltransferase [Faunimonas pinastri]
MADASAAKFDTGRAAEYAVQSRIALAGYDACHELAACILAAALGRGGEARILIGGAGGTAQEILTAAPQQQGWRFTAVDPAPAMLGLAREAVGEAGLDERVTFHAGRIEDLGAAERFDAATLIGVLHHLPGRAAKLEILKALAARLPAGAPLILAGNRGAYASRPLLLAAWGERWRMHGADEEAVKAKLGRILQGADPPASEEEVAHLLDEAGFAPPLLFFSSLFWGGWITTRKP